MRAGEVLRAAGLDGEELRALIHPIDPDQVVIRSAPSLLVRTWAKGTGAITLMRWVFIHHEILASDPGTVGRLVVHELVHVRQWSDYGAVQFLRRYLGEYFSGRRRGIGHRMAYWSNPFEEEARAAADRVA